MTIGAILAEVNLAIDENSIIYGSHLDTTLARSQLSLILSCARHALRYISQNAPLRMLDGSDETTDTGMFVDLNDVSVTRNGKTLTMPGDFVRLRRLRLDGWHRSVTVPVEEDSDEYLMLSDETATASIDRPVVALVWDSPCRLEMYPSEGNMEGSYVRYPVNSLNALSQNPISISDVVPIPPRLHMSFVYFTAYLVKLTHGDPNAEKWREVAIKAWGNGN